MAAAEELELNPLEMSDEEIDEAIARELNREAPVEQLEEPEELESAVEESVDEVEEVPSDDEEEETEEELQETEEVVEDETETDSATDVEEEGEEVATEEDTTDNTDVDSTEAIDYKAAYEELMAPFKANKTEIKVDSIEDVRKLMQMGANYHQKMVSLKPNLKMLKLLQNNDLLDQDKLSFLIDLDKKNPEAIKKLLKDSGVDPLDIDIADDSDYKPSTYNVTDSELALDSVISDIQGSSSFNRTMDTVGNKWDAASQDSIVKEPELLRIINEHMESGLFDQVMSVVERERMLGRLEGMSDIQAYHKVGSMITANEAQAKQPSQSFSTPEQPNSVNRAKSVDPKLKSRKKAASSTKSAPRAVNNDDFNPLSMSDDEFEQLMATKFS